MSRNAGYSKNTGTRKRENAIVTKIQVTVILRQRFQLWANKLREPCALRGESSSSKKRHNSKISLLPDWWRFLVLIVLFVCQKTSTTQRMGKGGSGNSSTGGPSGTLRKRPPKIPASSSSSPSPTLPSPNSSNYSNNNNNGTELTRQKLQHTSIAAYISYLTRIIIDKCKVSALAKVAALVIVVLLLVGGSIFWYFQPTIWLKNSPEVNELLSGRTIVTLYPAEINMEESLPNFFMGYGTLWLWSELNQECAKKVI